MYLWLQTIPPDNGGSSPGASWAAASGRQWQSIHAPPGGGGCEFPPAGRRQPAVRTFNGSGEEFFISARKTRRGIRHEGKRVLGLYGLGCVCRPNFNRTVCPPVSPQTEKRIQGHFRILIGNSSWPSTYFPFQYLLYSSSKVYLLILPSSLWISLFHYQCISMSLVLALSLAVVLTFWVLVLVSKFKTESFLLTLFHYLGPRITVPRSLRWASCGAIGTSATSALLVRLFSPECEPQNIAAFDRPEYKPA